MSTSSPYGNEGGDGERGAPAGSREALAEAMLRACDERGFEAVEVIDVLARGGGEPADFERHFADLGDCYAAAYEAEAGRLCEEILARGAGGGDWRQGLHAAIEFLTTFVASRPSRARTLLIDVHLAGDPAEHHRKQLSERLARAVDTAREEPDSTYSPPLLTSLFMVSAIEAAAVSALVRDQPESLVEAAPELEQLVLTAYFGD
jgi:hypothetical protein